MKTKFLVILFLLSLISCGKENANSKIQKKEVDLVIESPVEWKTRADGKLLIDYSKMAGKNLKVFCAVRKKGDASGGSLTYFDMEGLMTDNGDGTYSLKTKRKKISVPGDFDKDTYRIQCMLTTDNVGALKGGSYEIIPQCFYSDEEYNFKIPIASPWSEISEKKGQYSYKVKNLKFHPAGSMVVLKGSNISENIHLLNITINSYGFCQKGKFKLGHAENTNDPLGEELYFEAAPTADNTDGGLNEHNWSVMKFDMADKNGRYRFIPAGGNFGCTFYAVSTINKTINSQLIKGGIVEVQYEYSLKKNERINKAVTILSDSTRKYRTNAWLENGKFVTLTSQIPTKGRLKVNYKMNNWMKFAMDDLPFCKLLIPGTHDTEAVKFTAAAAGFTAFGQCQETHLEDQLNNGVRALDIRLHNYRESGELWIYHGFMATWIEFKKNILDVIEKFLTENPSETVVMMIKQENGGNEQNWIRAVTSQINEHPIAKRLVTGITLSTPVKEMRGKVLILSRNYLGGSFGYGYDLKNWGDNSSRQIIMIPYKSGESHVNLTIQDQYKDISTTEKAQLCSKILESSSEFYNAGMWCINYSSLSGNPGNNAWYINRDVLQYIQNSQKEMCGILYMDFVTRKDAKGPELMRAVVEKNF